MYFDDTVMGKRNREEVRVALVLSLNEQLILLCNVEGKVVQMVYKKGDRK
jgi:hypothetical protein